MLNVNFIILFFLIISLQAFTVYLDNRSNIFDFFIKIKRGKIATAYTNRGIYLTISRAIFFIVPPLLGYFTIKEGIYELKILMFFASLLTVIITTIQCKNYLIFFKLDFFNLELYTALIKKIDFYIGIFAFILFLMTPYLLNYLAKIFPDDGLWIVQLNPFLNSILILYVIWIFEPKLANKIDTKEKYFLELYEAISVRIIGRIFGLIMISLLIINT